MNTLIDTIMGWIASACMWGLIMVTPLWLIFKFIPRKSSVENILLGAIKIMLGLLLIFYIVISIESR